MNIKRHKHYGLMNAIYVEHIIDTVDNALNQYPRMLAIRIDLRFPDEEDWQDCPTQCYSGPDVISRFITSMKAQIRADIYRKRKTGKKSLNCKMRYIWVREYNQEGNKRHYHVLLLLNKDAYHRPGYLTFDDNYDRCTLFRMIIRAWLRTIKRDYAEKKYHGLVHIPYRAYYLLNSKKPYFRQDLQELTERALYLAKERSKDKSDGYRSFGCSQG